ncbi:hypothetical protein CPLU01_02820 [Colletotrichum plurivorum]|uniref:Uncharacterized protein n=1 Tax=Colletotrichum plurivorum TaxID=2175906 RepID=A0A8H6NLM1_9PEZI|nr:hypothetical protein CPLU01_02820 [Colletotrichum plurivorum]
MMSGQGAFTNKTIRELIDEIEDERAKTASTSDDKNEEVGKDDKHGKNGCSMKLPKIPTSSGCKKVRAKAKKATPSTPAPSSSPSSEPKTHARKRPAAEAIATAVNATKRKKKPLLDWRFF